ncbi:uncharacterized protein LOC131051497 [Cryptomeria japonica]|uniref:uncharacterized protein LOC131051497 n=1 Tax=Cryptomeria japonica TaxID=3369 RepID=UPI0025AB8D7C|nr:uncharacterized protein LOC131051497 [Cryptomeria japonica]
MVEKLGLKKVMHLTPYKVSWLQKGHQLLVKEQCKVDFQIGTYKDKIVCDVMPMNICHILLGRPWQYDRKAIHDGRHNTYTFVKDGKKHILTPLKEEQYVVEPSSRVILMGGKEFLHQMKTKEVNFALVGKLKGVVTSTKLLDLPEEIQDMLKENIDIVVDDLPDALPPLSVIFRVILYI